MKRAAALLLLVALSACATGGSPGAPDAPHKYGANAETAPHLWVVPLATIPSFGNAGTGTLFDTTAGGTQSGRYGQMHRLLVSLRCDQAITLQYQIKHTGSSTWRIAPGSSAGDAISANTDTLVDYLVQGPESRLQAVNGATAPSACEVDIEMFNTRMVGQ